MKRVVITSLFLLAASAQAKASGNQTVFHVSPKKTDFIIRLPSNASTGYRWYLVEKPAWIKVADTHYVMPPKARIGQGGVSEWRVSWPASQCQMPQRAQMSFVYARSWMPASSQEKKRDITVYCLPQIRFKNTEKEHTQKSQRELV